MTYFWWERGGGTKYNVDHIIIFVTLFLNEFFTLFKGKKYNRRTSEVLFLKSGCTKRMEFNGYGFSAPAKSQSRVTVAEIYL